MNNQINNMKRYEIIDAIEEIQDNNSKRFAGMNESELWTREDIADFVLKQLAEKDAEIERLKEELKDRPTLNDNRNDKFGYDKTNETL